MRPVGRGITTYILLFKEWTLVPVLLTTLASYRAFSCLSQQFSAIISMHDKDPRPPPDSAYHAGAEFLSKVIIL